MRGGGVMLSTCELEKEVEKRVCVAQFRRLSMEIRHKSPGVRATTSPDKRSKRMDVADAACLGDRSSRPEGARVM